MTWLLDTNTISFLLRNHPEVRARYDEQRSGPAPFVLSPVVDYEIRRYLLLKQATRNLARYEAVTQAWHLATLDLADWRRAAALWAGRHRLGLAIADADLLIAVTAIGHSATVVTNNLRHFVGLGVDVVHWTVPRPTAAMGLNPPAPSTPKG